MNVTNLIVTVSLTSQSIKETGELLRKTEKVLKGEEGGAAVEFKSRGIILLR